MKKELGIDASLVVGKPGEFSVVVGSEIVAKKKFFGGIPGDRKILASVKAKLGL